MESATLRSIFTNPKREQLASSRRMLRERIKVFMFCSHTQMLWESSPSLTADGLVAILGNCSPLGSILATAVKIFDAVRQRRLSVWTWARFGMLSPLALEHGQHCLTAFLPRWGLVL